MSLILWITLLSYVAVGMVFNLALLSYYREEKQGWSGNAKADKQISLLC